MAEENVLWSIAQSRLSSFLGVDIRCGGMHVRAHGLDKYLAKSCEHVWRFFRRQFVSNAECFFSHFIGGVGGMWFESPMKACDRF